MCGIAGILLPVEGTSRDLERTVRVMTGRLRHRGPDDEGFLFDRRVGLGVCRLAIIDLEGGKQPVTSENGQIAVIHNGEVYNFRELRIELERLGHRFRTQSDTEVIVHAYETWGPACVERFRGMFAFAVYDRGAFDQAPDRPVLFLARDRLGIKPLYYAQEGGVFVFASELRALLAAGRLSRRLDPDALWQYLAYQSVPSPRTLIADVGMLPPGHWLAVESRGTVKVSRYWDLFDNALIEAGTASVDAARRRVRELLHEAVSLHLVSDVPVAVFLSGGIDSSTVVALMHDSGVQRPSTFSVVFKERAYDEGRYSRAVAERFHTDHTEILLAERDVLDWVPEALAAMDQASGDGVNTYVVSRAVREKGIKVALSGLGGDELFGGYPSFALLWRYASWLRLWGCIPSPVRSLAARAAGAVLGASSRASKVAAVLESDGRLARVFPVFRELLSPSHRRSLLDEPWAEAAESASDPYVVLLEEAFARRPDLGILSRISYAETRTYTHDVLLRDTDQTSMAHGLEVRVPLLDHVLAEYVVGLPDAVKRAGGVPKRLLLETIGQLLPKEILQRPKQGFVLPFNDWMRGSLRSFCELRLNRLGQRGIFRRSELENLWHGFLGVDPKLSWSRLWLLVALEEWLDQNRIVT